MKSFYPDGQLHVKFSLSNKKLIEENIENDRDHIEENISLYTKDGDSQIAQMHKKYNDAVYNTKKGIIIAS